MQIKDTPAKELAPGLVAHYAHGERLTLGYIEVKAGSNLAEHKHEHEQITYILSGELDMIIDGTIYHLKTGMFHVIPSNTVHGAHALTDCKLIDVFNPVREDYR
ncbi:MAG: cupin domain-containing protein [Chitinophagaceae bacterium]